MIELLPLIYMTVFLIHVYMITASQIALQFFFKTGDNFDYRYIQNGFNFNCILELGKENPKNHENF